MIKIHNWEELAELEPSLTHYLNINLEYGFGRLINKDGTEEEYLPTHTFYGYGTSVELKLVGGHYVLNSVRLERRDWYV